METLRQVTAQKQNTDLHGDTQHLAPLHQSWPWNWWTSQPLPTGSTTIQLHQYNSALTCQPRLPCPGKIMAPTCPCPPQLFDETCSRRQTPVMDKGQHSKNKNLHGLHKRWNYIVLHCFSGPKLMSEAKTQHNYEAI